MSQFHFKFFLIFIFFSHYNFINASESTQWWKNYPTGQKFDCICRTCGTKVLLKATTRFSGNNRKLSLCLETSCARWHMERCIQASICSKNILDYFIVYAKPAQSYAIPATAIQPVKPMDQQTATWDPNHSVFLIYEKELQNLPVTDIF